MLAQRVAVIAFLAIVSPTMAAEDHGRGLGGEWSPRTDPSMLTTLALQREITALRELIITRLDAMDKAILLLQSRADKEPSAGDVDIKLLGLTQLTSEKFRSQELLFDGVQLQFKERDERVSQLSKSNETAINAALQSQKEAFAQQNLSFDRATQKAEVAFTEQIKQLNELIRTGAKSIDDKISTGTKVSDEKMAVINDRLTRVEAIKIGEASARGDQNTNHTLVIAVVGTLLSLVAVSITLVVAFRRPAGGNGNSKG